MALFPQTLSPWFGRVAAEVVLPMYVVASWPTPRDVTILSLAAGKGYLDHDIIDYYTGGKMPSHEYRKHCEWMRKKSKFIVSDHTDKAVELLHEQLDELVQNRRLKGRVDIRKLDALDFQLEKSPLGLVFANEMLDTLPIEPIIQSRSKNYQVYLIPHTKGRVQAKTDYQAKVGERFKKLKNRVLTADEFRGRLEGEEIDELLFHPVLLPLEANPQLQARVEGSDAFHRNVKTEDFGGIYPFQLGVVTVLDNIQRSFGHGAILFIDYASFGRGYKNWNSAINLPMNRMFGRFDSDFQVDFDQVIEEGRRRDMTCEMLTPQNELLKQSAVMVKGFGKGEFLRWAQANQIKYALDFIIPKALKAYANMTRTTSQFYRWMVLKF